MRFSAHAAAFNTTGFVCGTRERRLWHVSGVVRINLAMHHQAIGAESFEDACFESPGPERRGEWNRLLLGKRLKHTAPAAKLLVCSRSTMIGRIDFDDQWHAGDVNIVAGSALRGVQETLLLAIPGSEIWTDAGRWVITWNGISRK
jgi:hypothetical protein